MTIDSAGDHEPIARKFRRVRLMQLNHAKDFALEVSGISVPVVIKHSDRARRFILRMNKRSDGVQLTVPSGARIEDALAFARGHVDWVEQRVSQSSAFTPFADGAIVPFRGIDHKIVHAPGRRGTVVVSDTAGEPTLCVSGREEHLPRRLQDWFKGEARRTFTAIVPGYAGKLDVKPGKISIRDQTSRWGSCSSAGGLSFSWRLVLAPEDVLDYVAAHEVAHLLEMNHSATFWSHVHRICPHSRASMAWLKKNGATLHRYGAPSN